jgi:hypothetical protein
LPVITMMVPLYDEPGMIAPLMARLDRLDYPRELLDLCLVVERGDRATRGALAATRLPGWARAIVVPPGTPRTKPRALNYALRFARGDVVGIWDAEDAPAEDQLRRVAARFAAAPPEVACLQGRLTFYNVGRSWVTRCFAIDYAVWFSVVLPGLARLGLPVPLGGTTVFFRREALETVRGWDAHNVTEDADLGIRLARAGLRTEIIDTATAEEATAGVQAWVRQRSRWKKGYLQTWLVHTRSPLRAVAELGWRGFLGMQLLLLGGVANALLAPAMWTTGAMILGWRHPVQGALPGGGPWPLAAWITLLTLATLTLGIVACRRIGRPGLALWSPLLVIYSALASAAVLRALVDLAIRPFHWDKTAHGGPASREEEEAATRDPPPPRRQTPGPSSGQSSAASSTSTATRSSAGGAPGRRAWKAPDGISRNDQHWGAGSLS